MKLLLACFVLLGTVSQSQSCTAGSMETGMDDTNTVSAVYVNRRGSEDAECDGTVYAWHYCYYPGTSSTNLEVAFGVFSFNSNVYTLRDGSYHLLHLNTINSTFTCRTLTLDPTQYFQIHDGDQVGACLRENDYLNIVREHHGRRVHHWTGGVSSCTENEMTTSPNIGDPDRRRNLLHLYVDINTDECADGDDNCDEHATCEDVIGGDGSFQCKCDTGYTGNGVECNNVDECSSGTHNCAAEATCTDTDGSFVCTCSAGYVGDGIMCTASCDPTCPMNAKCSVTEGVASCSCNTGYTGDGLACDNIDECATDVDNCADQAICYDTEGSFFCTCNTGYVGDGTECNDIDECDTDIDNCADQATCSDTDGSFFCDCNTGYVGDGTECIDLDECVMETDNNCNENAVCSNTIGSYSCSCTSGYSGSGITCANIDECMTGEHNCAQQAMCTETVGSFRCECNEGYTGNGVVCNDFNECSDGSPTCNENAVCTNTAGSYNCSCTPGYSGDGMRCADIDECHTGVPKQCSSAADCVNTIGSYSCQCKPGYEGDGYNCSALPDVSGGPVGQRAGGSTGLATGAAVGGLLVVVAVVVAIGALCAVRFRTHRTKSVSIPVSDNIGFGNRLYGMVNGRITITKLPDNGEPTYDCASDPVTAQQRDLDNPIYDGVLPLGEKESQFTVDEAASGNIYDSPRDLTQPYSSNGVWSSEGLGVYECADEPHRASQHGSKVPLECYSAVDYYSTLNDLTEQVYEEIIKEAEKSGGAVEDEDSADLYYCPAEREDELYQQLQRQRIKSIPSSHIKQLGVLGSGEFGTVCKGQWIYADKVVDVAIKVLSDASNEANKVKFLQEAAIMSQFRHPNVIKLYGVVTVGQQIMLIVELLEKGDLHQALAKMRPDPGQLHASGLPQVLLTFSRQTALGMVYLSGKGFVHRDIAARNILLSSERRRSGPAGADRGRMGPLHLLHPD